jgi:hypothetical protein
LNACTLIDLTYLYAYGVLLVLSVNLGNFFYDVFELLSDLVHLACTKITLIIMVDEKTIISVSNDHHSHACIMFKNNNDASMMLCCFLDKCFVTCGNIKSKYKG